MANQANKPLFHEHSATTPAVLVTQALGIRRAGQDLLQGLDLTLHAGEVMAIVGPNGAGKSSLLHALSEELPAPAGEVFLGGKLLADWSATERARQLAVLPQGSRLNFPYRVEEVVALGRLPHRTGQALDETIVGAAMTAMDIAPLRARIFTELSGGEKQRVQLARVLAQIWRDEDAPSRCLLLDEPTAALDLGHQQQLMATIRNFAQQGVAVAMVVHDLNLAAQYADRLLALAHGEVLAQGCVSAVLTRDLVKSLFGPGVTCVAHPETGRLYVLP